MNAIISVVGKDTVGILAAVSEKCAKHKANINDVRQTINDNYFAMFMIVDIDKLNIEFNDKNLEIHCMHENIFNLMHNI